MRFVSTFTISLALLSSAVQNAAAQAYCEPGRGEPGDRMIQEYLERTAIKIQNSFVADLTSAADWQIHRPLYREEYFYMLGLSPLPERTDLKATITGTLTGDGFIVDMLHYQSVPGLYVTANLYRPATVKAGERLPAVFYVCGHSGRGRDGNKTAYQSHGMWFAWHGFICLVVDTLQLGEIAAIHHGTYNQNRWWWQSRGYTSAGVECWNGVRGIDYLVSRPDVDPERIAVTGISGGGAATFWIAAADERVRVAVPVSGMADLMSYVPNRVINGHCDCMFLYNTFEWPWVRIAGLVAPRPLLFVNSDKDAIFPMDANERVINQLERLYSLYGEGDRVDSVVSVGGHEYRHDIRQAVYRFINTWLKDDSRAVTDGDIDIVEFPPAKVVHPIEPVKLRAFATDKDIPADQLNTTIDQHFVPMARVAVPGEGQFESWKKPLLAELRRVSFRTLPERVPAGQLQKVQESPVAGRLETEPGIFVRLESIQGPFGSGAAKRVLLFVQNAGKGTPLPKWIETIREPDDRVYRCEPRGIGDTRWTAKSPPNTILRSHALLGRTADTGRVYDVIATARFLKQIHKAERIEVTGEGAGAILAAYAALWEPDIDGVVAHQPFTTHMDAAAPQFLNVLRVADIPDLFGLIAPRSLTIVSDKREFQKTAAIYRAAGAGMQITFGKAE